MNPPAECFSATYAEARQKFLHAAGAAGLNVRSHPHPLPGRDAEALAMDVVIDGNPAAGDLLILSSGCHGIEGFGGSGAQVSALLDTPLREQAASNAVTLVHIHALNPHGFSHWRRNTHENVDLNRNFHDFSRPLPENEAFRELHPILLPETWPPTPGNQAEMLGIINRLGSKTFQSVVARGQHYFPDGLFFGGSGPCWSNLTLRKVLREIAGRARRVAWIDIHTGLGPTGKGERILACRDGTMESSRAESWWGPGLTSINDDTSVSTFLTGPMWTALPGELPQAGYTGIAIEFGTVPVMQVLHALRAENWLHAHPEATAELTGQIAALIRGAFHVDTDEWKSAVISQTREATAQAIVGLAVSRGRQHTLQ